MKYYIDLCIKEKIRNSLEDNNIVIIKGSNLCGKSVLIQELSNELAEKYNVVYQSGCNPLYRNFILDEMYMEVHRYFQSEEQVIFLFDEWDSIEDINKILNIIKNTEWKVVIATNNMFYRKIEIKYDIFYVPDISDIECFKYLQQFYSNFLLNMKIVHLINIVCEYKIGILFEFTKIYNKEIPKITYKNIKEIKNEIRKKYVEKINIKQKTLKTNTIYISNKMRMLKRFLFEEDEPEKNNGEV